MEEVADSNSNLTMKTPSVDITFFRGRKEVIDEDAPLPSHTINAPQHYNDHRTNFAIR